MRSGHEIKKDCRLPFTIEKKQTVSDMKDQFFIRLVLILIDFIGVNIYIERRFRK